ncbi:MAG: methyltransferase, TIGR04325 family [Gemmataceae bacterium]
MVTRLLPPTGILRFARRILGKVRNASSLPTRHAEIYSNYAEASRACDGCDYEFDQIVETVYRKTLILRETLQQGALSATPQDTQLLLGVKIAGGSSKTGTIHVLDYGGACGAHYYTVKAALGNTDSLRWHVVETPAMVAKAKGLENQELKFHSTLSAAREICPTPDLVFSSGTLQCVPDPHASLQELLAIGSQYVLLNRLGLNSGSTDVFTVHTSRLSANGPGPLPDGIQDREVRYPFQFISKQALDQAVLQQYAIRLHFDDASGMFQVGPELILGCGYLLEKRNGCSSCR